MINKLRIVVLFSGNGSNLQAIIDACQQHKINAQVVAVISSNPNAFGLKRAENAQIPSAIVDPKQFTTTADHDSALIKTIDSYHPDLIVLAGYMRILSQDVVAHYLGKMINIHPSLLPKYPGLHTYEKAIAAGDKEHGSSVHFVTNVLDGGPLIAQSRLAILPDDTPESLAARNLVLEHELYPRVIGWFAEGKVKFENIKSQTP